MEILKRVGSMDGDGPFGTRVFRGHDQGFLKGSRPEPLPVKKDRLWRRGLAGVC